jgi:cation diffusion facilitator family transporter
LTDAGSSLITLLGFRLSEQKPDKDHPFGHGRFEYISGFIVSIIILLVGFALAKTSFERIITPVDVEFSYLAVFILVCAIVVKGYMAFYNFSIGRTIGSSAMKATGVDSLSDTFATSVVLICMFVAKYTSFNIDAYCSLAVALFIMYSGFKSAKETIDPLLGSPPDEAFINSIYSVVLSYPEIIGVHDLVVHDYGPGRLMISLHAEVDAASEMITVHDIIDNVEKELCERLNCSAVIHMDPIETDNEIINMIKDKITKKIFEIDERLSIHDLRTVCGPTHTNIIFDIVVPFDFSKSDSELKTILENFVQEIDKNYYTVMNIDRAYN